MSDTIIKIAVIALGYGRTTELTGSSKKPEDIFDGKSSRDFKLRGQF